MIWLFKVNEVFWGNKPEVNDYYLFEEDDINFDITKYDITLYFPTANYFLLKSPNEIFFLEPPRGSSTNSYQNPNRIKLYENTDYFKCVNDYYNTEIKQIIRDNKINNLLQ